MTADPVAQAIVALCDHPRFDPECPRCAIRRDEAVAYLVRRCDTLITSLDS